MMTEGESMKLQCDTGQWINSRHISVYYISGQNTISCKLIDCEGEHIMLRAVNEPVTQDLLDDMMRVITAKSLNQPLLSQHDLWQELNRLR